MVIATRPGQTWDYVLERDRVPAGATAEEAARIQAQATVWKLAALSLADRAALEDHIGQVDVQSRQFRTNTGSNTLTVLRVGLKGVENFCGPDAMPVTFQTSRKTVLGVGRDVPTDGFLEHIAPDDRRELADAITEGQRLTTEEKKG